MWGGVCEGWLAMGGWPARRRLVRGTDFFGSSPEGLRPRWPFDDILFFAVARKSTRTSSPLRLPPAAAEVWTSLQWRTLSSPVRFELFTLAEGAAPCSISDLAKLSGRRASSLYRHVEALVRARLLVASERRRAGRRFETVYALGPMATARSIDNGPPSGPKGLPARTRAHVSTIVERGFRTAARNVRTALEAGHRPLLRDPSTPMSFFFEVTWLDDARRRRLHAHMRAIADLVVEGRAKRTGALHGIVASFAPLDRGT